jgi:hypothetical protein
MGVAMSTIDFCAEAEKIREAERQQYAGSAKQEPENLSFPAHVMRGAAGDFARLYGKYTEAPMPFLYFSYLACLGTIVLVTAKTELSPQTRLYLLLLGQSADDRKSTSINKAVDLFSETLPEKFNYCLGVGSAEGLQRHFETLQSKRLLLCYDEFKHFVSKSKIETSVLLPCVNTLFESNNYETHTKSHDIILRDARLSLLAASTVQTYESTWSNAFTDIGFNNRLFIVVATASRKHSIPEQIPYRDKLEIKESLLDVVSHSNSIGELAISQEAKEIYHNWYMNLERSIHAKRLDTYALRFMCLLAANELKHEIDAETVRQAISLCDWQLQIRKIHDPIDADNTTAKMEEKIRRVLASKPLDERDLKRLVSYHRVGVWFYETAKNNLQRAGEIFWDKKLKQWVLKK